MHIIEILIFSFFFIVIVVSQLNHMAINALKGYPDDYESAGRPEPARTIGLMNWKYTQYLLGGGFENIEDSKSVNKLKIARYGVVLSICYFVSMVCYLLISN